MYQTPKPPKPQNLNHEPLNPKPIEHLTGSSGSSSYKNLIPAGATM